MYQFSVFKISLTKLAFDSLIFPHTARINKSQASFVRVIVNTEKCTQPICHSLLIYKIDYLQDFVLGA